MKTNKLAFFAAAATLTFAGAAFAQTTSTPGQQVPATSSPAATPTPPATTPVPPAEATTTTTTTTAPASMTDTTAATATTPAPQPSADTAATPSSATVTADYKVGTEVKDPAGVSIGTISGTSAAADGSVNVVITNGAVKFALPSASLATKDGVLSTTATKAQIDATLAGAKPQ